MGGGGLPGLSQARPRFRQDTLLLRHPAAESSLGLLAGTPSLLNQVRQEVPERALHSVLHVESKPLPRRSGLLVALPQSRCVHHPVQVHHFLRLRHCHFEGSLLLHSHRLFARLCARDDDEVGRLGRLELVDHAAHLLTVPGFHEASGGREIVAEVRRSDALALQLVPGATHILHRQVHHRGQRNRAPLFVIILLG